MNIGKGVLLMLSLLQFVGGASQGHTQETGLLSNSLDIRAIRERQRKLAGRQNVVINQVDVGQRSTSNIQGIPLELREMNISGVGDVVESIDRLYPYYGFQGSESLIFETMRNIAGETSYIFREYINEIETPVLMTVWVDDSSGQIARITGSPYIDRGLGTSPNLSAQSAINDVIQTVQRQNGSNHDYRVDGAHRAEIVYYPYGDDWALEPFWQVGLELQPQDGIPRYQFFLVDPDGGMRDAGISEYLQ